MAMKNPPHPGEGLRDELDALGLAVSEAAEAVGVSRQHLYAIISGISRISPEMALRLEKALGGSAIHWLRLQAAYELAQVRLREPDLAVRRLVREDP
jgi:addiction module HigA family antidote